MSASVARVGELRIAYERRGHGPPLIMLPTLLIYGDEDVRAPRAVREALHDAIPGSQLVMLSGVGHVSTLEAPERVNEEVRSFLDRVPI